MGEITQRLISQKILIIYVNRVWGMEIMEEEKGMD
jgi:hypothetical protein